jgi:beta-aspartyl-peptidase (threonine type)
MKIISFLFFISFLASSTCINNQGLFAQTEDAKYTIVIHGGAGFISPDIDESLKNQYLNSLIEALNIGKNILEAGGSSLNAVEKVVRFLEDDSLFNAGRGAVFNSIGVNELDASIMDGRDLSSGAVAGVKIIKNPISLARLVMEKTRHILFAGEGADKLGIEFGVETVKPEYFKVEKRFLELQNLIYKDDNGTVGCVAIDKFGNLAAATSTGGLTGKIPGRVGDSPLVNAGTYANNNTCGVSGTGVGELFIKNTIAYKVSVLMEYKGYTLQKAAEELIYKVLPEETAGIIAVDKDGNFALEFNTTSMTRGVATSDGVFEVKIWK